MLTQSSLRRCHWRCAHAWFMQAALGPRVGEISRSIFSAREPEPPLWLCPGTGWLLSACLTNPVPLPQISLLPILANIMRADLRASRGVRQHLRVCVGLDGRMREERMLWRLEIYWLPSAASLPTSFRSPAQVSYSLAVYLCWRYRPLLCSMLQPPTDTLPPTTTTSLHCRGLPSVPTALWWQRMTAIKCCAQRRPLPTPSIECFSPTAALCAALISMIKTESRVAPLLCAGFTMMRFEYEWMRALKLAVAVRGGGGWVKRWNLVKASGF